MANANLLAILVAAAAGFLVGGIWYGPLFGKAWMEEHGFTEEGLKNANMLKIYGLTFAFRVVSAVFLGHLLAHFGEMSARSTMMITIGTNEVPCMQAKLRSGSSAAALPVGSVSCAGATGISYLNNSKF